MHTLILLATLSKASAYSLRGAKARLLYATDDDGDCSAFCEMLFGLFILIVTPVIIYWNERQHVKIMRHYAAAQRVVKTIDDPNAPPEDCDGKLVCFSGALKGAAALTDVAVPSITVDDALLLSREVEIMQWHEEKGHDKKWVAKKKWFRCPQPDCKHTGMANSIGNWQAFTGDTMLSTGHKQGGADIYFGDDQTIFRAPKPFIGNFDLNEKLMDEMFVGTKHLHRIHQLLLVKEMQGTWSNVPLDQPIKCIATDTLGASIQLNRSIGDSVEAASQHSNTAGTLIHALDGNPLHVGTIRIHWRVAKQQQFTILAEAVKPGRSYTGTYGTDGFNIQDGAEVKRRFNEELHERDEVRAPLNRKASSAGAKLVHPADARWALTPFHVLDRPLVPCLKGVSVGGFVLDEALTEGPFLGRLWMFGPGDLRSNELFRKMYNAEQACACVMRATTLILLYLGWLLLFSPLTTFARWIPFGFLVTYAVWAACAVLASTCWVSLTALMWFVVHPIATTLTLAAFWGLYLYLCNTAPDDVGY